MGKELARTGSLFNHSSSPNVSYEIKQSEYTIHYKSAKPIKKGQELFIFYGHSVRFAGDPSPTETEEESVDDGWGGLGNLEEEENEEETSGEAGAKFRQMTEEELSARDNEIVGFEEPEFPFRKITEIVDPEDAELTTS
jgi:tRNA-specific adenosine deaminase 3